MATNLIRRSCRLTCFFSSFDLFLFERQSAFTCVTLRHVDAVQDRRLHCSGIMCGGKPKSVWRRKRAPALTKLSPDKPEKFKTRKAFGGGEKTKVTRAKEGMYTWKSQEIDFRTPILNVLYNSAHKDFTEQKIMVCGTVVEIDSKPFQTWYVDQGRQDESDVIKEDKEKPEVDDRILHQLKSGKVLAKVSSRPGQEGKVNGYILEGEELSKYIQLTKT